MSDWTSQRLGEHHDLAQLDCGRDELDRWLLHEASRAQAAGIAHTTVGTQLLLDALERIVAAATNAGGRLIAVDALDDAAHGFYRHHHFQPIQGSRRLVMKIATARAALDR